MSLCCWCGKTEIKPIEDSHGICRPCLNKQVLSMTTSEEKLRLLKLLARRYEMIEKIEDRQKRLQMYTVLEQLILIIDEVMKVESCPTKG